MTIVAATQGSVTITGVIGNTLMYSLRIPAGSMGRNGHIEVKMLWSMTSSANNKQALGGFNTAVGVGGLTVPSSTWGAVAGAQSMWVIRNNNATNAQITYGQIPATSPFGSGTLALSTGAIDTTQDTYVNIFGNSAGAGEVLTLVHAYAVVFPTP